MSIVAPASRLRRAGGSGRGRGDELDRWLPAAVCGGMLVVVAVGLLIHLAGGGLGTPLPPFLMSVQPRVNPRVVVSVVVLAAGVLVGGGLIAGEREAGSGWGLAVGSAWRFAVAVYLLAMAVGLAVNLGAEGVRGWSAVFDAGRGGSAEGQFEYLISLPLLGHGAGYFLAHFGSLLQYASTHVKGNPPGPLIAMHLLGVDSPGELAALCVGVGALCSPLAYELGRRSGPSIGSESGERRGRLAGVLTAFSPAVILFGVSSTDYAFAALGMAAICLLVSERRAVVLLGAGTFAVATFFSWLLFAVVPFVAGVVWLRRGLMPAVWVSLACALCVVAMNLTLWAIYGYSPFDALSATHHYYSHGIATIRPYAFWLFGSPAAWGVMLGLPVVWFAVRAATRGDAVALSLLATVGLAAVIGVTKAETERIWLPFVPLACVAAAAVLPRRRVMPVLIGLAAQALIVELLFFTTW